MFWRFSKQIKTPNRVLFFTGFCSFHQGTGNSKMLKSWYRASNSKHGTVLIRQLSSSSLSESEVPVIRIPRYMERSIGNAIYKEHRKVKEVREKQAARDKLPPLEPKHVNKLIISWNGDKRLNHYYGYRYDTRKGASEVPLISKQWSKRASVGQQMTFHQFDVNPSLLEVDSSSAADQEKKTFAALGLNENIVAAINQSVTGKTTSPVTPSSIQFGVIPFILARRNVIFSSETGSGKTVAYLAPVIQLIEEQKALDAARFGADYHRRRSPYGLVVLPSRELTEQVGGVARQLSAGTGVGVATMIGGVPKKGEGGAGIAHTGLDLVVTTSGMIESHLNRGVYHLHRLQHVVLDEADTLLDDTFSYEVVDLLENLNIKSSESAEMIESEDDEEDGGGGAFQNLSGTQLICASATLPTTLDSTLGGLLNLAEDVERVTTKALHNLHSNVKHRFYRVGKYERESKLVELLAEDRARGRPVIVFANRTDAADWIYHTLVENDHRAVRLTAAMAEEERLHAFRAFQQGEHDVLVATDLGSRGLDTRRVRHVINYDCPHYVSDYIHRAGRVGRLGSSGEGGGQGAALVTTMVAFKPDAAMVAQLERALRLGGEIQCPNANIKAQLSQRRADKRSKAMRDEV